MIIYQVTQHKVFRFSVQSYSFHCTHTCTAVEYITLISMDINGNFIYQRNEVSVLANITNIACKHTGAKLSFKLPPSNSCDITPHSQRVLLSIQLPQVSYHIVSILNFLSHLKNLWLYILIYSFHRFITPIENVLHLNYREVMHLANITNIILLVWAFMGI